MFDAENDIVASPVLRCLVLVAAANARRVEQR